MSETERGETNVSTAAVGVIPTQAKTSETQAKTRETRARC